MNSYKFRRRTLDLPEGVEVEKSFEAIELIEALQMASDYWFRGAVVKGWVFSDHVITLLGFSEACESNVIGTLVKL